MSNIKLFESTQIRSVWLEDEQKWFFSVVDVVAALTDSAKPRDYWYRIKQREKISDIELPTICRQLKLPSPDGKERETVCANAEGLLRIIQSIPSPKAEPFKRWLAQVGYERLEEIENPELAAQRMRAIYQSKGYSPEWIEKRARGIANRRQLARPHERPGTDLHHAG
jgi:prophage antirepressor-like protein